ncbi:hypothetical protein BDV98DRAFT_514549, partial [Pterulicium gracile]
DKTVRIWDAKSGEEVAKMEGHDTPVASVAFSHDSTLVVSGSRDNTMRVWTSSRKDETHAIPHGLSTQLSANVKASPLPIGCSFSKVGWITKAGQPRKRLFWYPPHLHRTLMVPRCRLVICRDGRTTLDLSSAKLGPEWTQIYQEQPSDSSVQHSLTM